MDDGSALCEGGDSGGGTVKAEENKRHHVYNLMHANLFVTYLQ